MTIAKGYSRCLFETQVSNYDRVTAWLVASIIVLGALLVILATMIWRESLEPKISSSPPLPLAAPFVPDSIDTDDLVDPGMEAPELQSEIIDLGQFESDVLFQARTRSSVFSDGSGDTPGRGDQRRIGPPDFVPDLPGSALQRWKITYELSDIANYSDQLRFFEIELGLVSENTNEIWRIADVGRQNHVLASSRAKESRSAYFANSNSRMARWDRSFVEKSRVESKGCDPDHAIVVHFYPASTVARLQAAELNAVPLNKKVEQIRETDFRLVKTDNGFEFEVTRIKFE